MSLCKRYVGGQGRSTALLQAILPMVSLVYRRRAEVNNKKTWTQWLKTAARTLLALQVANREWINEHIWALPAIVPGKEQVYDPLAGTRDIRYFPVTERCATPTREEEDALLRSPTKTVDDVFDVSFLLSESPRRSPRLAAKAKSVLTVHSEAVTSSLASTESSVPLSASSQKEGAFSSSSWAETPCPREASAFSYASKDVSTNVKTKRYQKQQSRAKSTSWNVSASRSTLRVSSPRRTVSVSTSSVLPRYPGQSPMTALEPLVISKQVLVRPKVGEVLKRVQQQRDVQLQHDKKACRQRQTPCLVPGCGELTSYLKVHAFSRHLPGIFTETLPVDDPLVLKGRVKALEQAARWLLGKPSTLSDLLKFLLVNHLFTTIANTVSEGQHAAMASLCSYLKLPVPQKFVLEPANSEGVLVHWKVVLLLVASLDGEERLYWLSSFPAPEGMVPVVEEIPEIADPEVEILPNAFDSHFHLDRTLKELHLSHSGSLEDILAVVRVHPEERVRLVGSVAVFCDPKTYPSKARLSDLSEDVVVAVGFHPRHAQYAAQSIDRYVRDMATLLNNPRVKALGEIGLDHTEPMRFWHVQVDLLRKVLPLLQEHHVLVIHCRGMAGDCGTEAYLLLLYMLRKQVRSRHPIHLHCFGGNQYVLQRWTEVFPRTFFGFTNLVRTFSADQVEALKSLDEGQLLLESDAPYFPSMGTRYSSPGQLYTVAKEVAKHREVSPEYLLDVTVNNARLLYSGN